MKALVRVHPDGSEEVVSTGDKRSMEASQRQREYNAAAQGKPDAYSYRIDDWGYGGKDRPDSDGHPLGWIYQPTNDTAPD